jgi:hypothetical protein
MLMVTESALTVFEAALDFSFASGLAADEDALAGAASCLDGVFCANNIRLQTSHTNAIRPMVLPLLNDSLPQWIAISPRP